MSTQITTSNPDKLWITHVSAVGPYLKISGQLNPMTDLSKQLEENVLPICESVKNSTSLDEKKKKLHVDDVYLVRSVNQASPHGNTEYLRTRIVRLIETTSPQNILFVEVEFIDMGYKKVIQCDDLLIAPKGNKLLTMPALSSQYLMLGIFGNFTLADLEEVLSLIVRQHLMITVEMEIEGHKFIKMKWKDWDFAEFLVSQRKIGAPINRDLQQDDFLRLLQEQAQDLKYDSVNACLNDNNNSYTKNNNNLNSLSNGSSGSFNANNFKPNTFNRANAQAFRPVYGSGRINPTNQSSDTALLLKKQLLAREIQLQKQIELDRQQLMQSQLMQQQIIQRMVTPQLNLPQNARNSFPHYMLGNIQQQISRLPTPAVYATMPVLPSLRIQRPLLLPRADPNIFNTNNNTMHSAIKEKSTAAVGSKIYKINKFVVGSIYDVCVSFVENGPCNFSVQLNDAQMKLTAMMNQIERIQLKNLNCDPTIGMACIARYSEDGHMYRAVVNSAQTNSIKVIYIDYGNSEYVKKSELYEIPQEFLSEPVFALPVSLAGLKSLGPIDDSLKKTFKEMVVYQKCKLKVTSPEGPPVVQYCELYLQNKNMLEVLQEIQKSRLVYPKAVQLCSNDAVEIRFIDSPRSFYVQNANNIDEFDKLMDDMDKYYNSKQVVPQQVAVGAAYAVKNDYEWYRAEVIRADELAIIVRFIDFGYERVVTKNLLSNIAEQHLKMPRQAVHCCLKGFESNELSNKDIATTQFEMLAEESTGLRRLFTIKVFRIHPDDLHIVNLFTKELNVMKKLYKLSMPFEQYLTLEKEDFNLGSGSSNVSKVKQKEQNTKTYSTNSSNENSSKISKNSIKNNDIIPIKTASPMPLMQQNHQPKEQSQQAAIKQHPQVLQQHQHTEVKPQFLIHSTPAQRLQQHSNKNKSVNGTADWDNNSSASSNMSKHKQQQRANNNSPQQQHQQQHIRKPQYLDPLNSSFESADRRSDASTNSHRSRNINTARQKDRHHNKDSDTSRTSAPRSKKPRQAQQQQKKNLERSENAPQGYSQSRRGSMDSQYGAIISDDSHKMSPKSIAAAAAATVLSLKQSQEYVPLDYAFPIEPIKTPVTEDVTICWWISTHQFYTHRKVRAAAFEEIMREIQKFYHKKPLEQLKLKPGAHVIARHRKDRMHYRARIIACNPMLRKYKVLFVDFGNQYTVSSEDIWQVEKRFADFPVMAYCCSFKNIVSNFDHLYIIDRMEKYLPNGAVLSCEYKEKTVQDVYYVNVKVNNASLLDRLKNDKIVTEISPDLRLELLAGQQIRAKIISIKNMLNFKIIFEGCDVPLLCSYDDVRFVKSNPDMGQRFKQFYEGKSCVVNIKSVNDNKLILLRPLLPLFVEDIPSFICCKPRVSQTFEGRLVFIASAYRLYVHDSVAETKVAKLLDEMYSYYENQGSILTSFCTDQICAAKSEADTNWYRARIIHPKTAKDSAVEVYYIDYGNSEILEKNQLKILEPQFFVEQNALAIEINLPVVMWSAGDKKSKAEDLHASAIEQLRLMLEEQLLTVKALDCRRNHLIAEVSLKETGKNAVDQLLAKKYVKARDLEFMSKQLEKDKSSMLEFFETVDLTLEDEDTPIKVSAPRNKKTQNIESPKKSDTETEKELSSTSSTISAENVNEQKPAEVAASTPTSSTTSKINEPATTPVLVATAAPVEQLTPKVEPLEDYATECATSASPVPSSSSLFDNSNMEQAVLSHCDNPAQFFIHAYDKIDQLHKLQENLQIVASSLPPLMNVYNGANCISLYSVDKQWYRAEIIDAELMVLKFIDFGNTDCVTDTTDIKEMSVFPDIEPLCIPCALPIRPNNTADWVDAANAIFNESYEKMLYFTYITQSDAPKKPSYIHLYIDGINIAKRLIDDGFAKPLELVETGENCYISHVNSLNDFYIQYEKDSKGLELIELCLESYEKLPQLKEFLKHKIVAALFHDDEKWYRAKLLRDLTSKAEGASYEVLFIDYGNTAISRECREIPAEIAELPALSKKCALELNLDVYFGWSEAAEAKFAEIASCGDTIFNIELRAPAPEYALVHLYIDTLNVNTELEPLCLRRTPDVDDKSVEVGLNASFGAQSVATIDPNDTTQLHTSVVSHLDSAASFFVQFEKDSARLEDLTATLNATIGMDILSTTAEVGKLYASVFDEDQQLYRVRVLKINANEGKDYEVLFVDYGNKAVVKELRILPLDLQNIREIAKHCTLNKIEELEKLGVGAIESFRDIVNSADGVVKLEFATSSQSDGGPFKVNLYTLNSNENILEKIKAQNPIHENIHLLSAARPQNCLISHYVSPREFYVQLPNQIAKLNSITQMLAKEKVVASMAKVSPVPALNQIYAVYAEDDDLYYRGLVIAKLETDNKVYHAFLIDYGNKMYVNELRELPAELKNMPPMAELCELANIDGSSESETLLNEHFQTLMEAHFGETFEIECAAAGEHEKLSQHTPTAVKLKINGEDVATKLSDALKTGGKTLVDDAPPIVNDCAIVHVNSPSSFYIQLLQDTLEIETLTEALLDAETEFPEFTDLQFGAICAARFSEDDNFYRCCILEVIECDDATVEGDVKDSEKADKKSNKKSCLVHFIDFGNNSIATDFRQLPEALSKQRRFSKHCSLDIKFKNIEAATRHFQAYIDEHYSETFQIELINENKKADSNELLMTTTTTPVPCRLFNQTKNVASKIEKMLKEEDE